MLRALMFAAPLTFLLAADTRTSAADEELPIVKMLKSKLKDEKQTFAILVTFKVKAGNEKKFEAAFVPCLAATRKEAGCVAYVLNRDTDDPTTYIMYESFKGIPGIEAHMKEKHTQTLLATVGPMCEGEPKIKVLTVPE